MQSSMATHEEMRSWSPDRLQSAENALKARLSELDGLHDSADLSSISRCMRASKVAIATLLRRLGWAMHRWPKPGWSDAGTG